MRELKIAGGLLPVVSYQLIHLLKKISRENREGTRRNQ